MTPPRTGRFAWTALAAIVALHVGLALLHFDPTPSVAGDNAAYMILAESLAEGRGYRDLYRPGTPHHTQYPLLYPALLAGARLLGGDLASFKALSLVCNAAGVVLLFLLARARLDPPGALAVTAVFACNPVLLFHSHAVLSEAPFVALTLAGLWACERLDGPWRWPAAAMLAALLAYLTRAAGLPLAALLLLALAWRRRWRVLAASAAAALAVVGGWILWGLLAAPEGEASYWSTLLLANPYDRARGTIGAAGLLARVLGNASRYATHLLPGTLAGPAAGPHAVRLAALSGLLLVALALVECLRDLRRGRVLGPFAAAYTALILVRPPVWTSMRMLLPLLPVLLVLAAAGAGRLLARARRMLPRGAPLAAACALILLALPEHQRAIAVNARCRESARRGEPTACYTPHWQAFVRAAEWVREHTDEGAVVVSRKPRLFYHFARRRGDGYPYTDDRDALLAFLDRIGADYVVVAGLSGTTGRYLLPAIRSAPERFEQVHVVTAGAARASVLAYRRPPVNGPASRVRAAPGPRGGP